MSPKLPIHCPACSNTLNVSQLHCNNCETTVNGNFSLPLFLKLLPEEQDFILQFLINSGSLKEMAKQMSISYPTLRNKLDDLIEKIKLLQENEDTTL
jgi:hypothetical protein